MSIKEIKDSFGKFLNTFRIKKEERLPSLAILLMMAALNAVAISKYYSSFSKTHQAIWGLFVRKYTVSGFDPITYCVLTEWEPKYEVFRHPLLAYFEYPLYLLNQALTAIFDTNCAQVIVGVILVVLACYTWIFMYRILREIVGLSKTDAIALSLFFFSFGYVMLTLMVPDHFAVSMFMLVTCLYICGKAMQKGRQLKIWQTWLVFIFTAGTTLSNGIKIFLDALFVNGRHFFRLKYFFLGVIAPCLVIWAFATWEFRQYTAPRERASLMKRIKKGKEERAKHFIAFCDTTSLKDSTAIAKAFDRKMKQIIYAKYQADHKQPWHTHKGRPMGKGRFMGWTDETTSRADALVENVFGEPIQIHKDYLLQDVLRGRPVVVEYKYAINYIVEGIIVVLFVLGIICGIKNRFLQMALSGVAFDAAIHLGLGFGLNEVYIMTAHWIFILPLAIAYLFKRSRGMWLVALRSIVLVMTCFLFAYNITLLTDYFL
ncbi:MAG: DUF6080 domain-containing protein [Prevotella sp.]